MAFPQESACSPYQYVHSTNQLGYYLPFNNPENFQAQVSFCASKNIYYSSATNYIIVTFSIVPSYLLTLTLQVLTSYVNQTVLILLSSPNLVESPTYALSSQARQSCNNQSLIFSNIKANFTPKLTTSQSAYPMQLKLSIPLQNLIGVSQLLVEQMPCGVTNCGICITAFTCQQCLPGFYL